MTCHRSERPALRCTMHLTSRILPIARQSLAIATPNNLTAWSRDSPVNRTFVYAVTLGAFVSLVMSERKCRSSG